MLTAEKQRVVIDWYVRWRITDPQDYIRNVGLDENAGAMQLNRVVRNAFQENINKRTVRDLISVRREALMADVQREVLAVVKGAKPWGVDVRRRAHHAGRLCGSHHRVGLSPHGSRTQARGQRTALDRLRPKAKRSAPTPTASAK